MTSAAGFIFIPPKERRQILLNPPRSFFSSDVSIAEPVGRFNHSRNAPLLVFGCFQDGKVTHVAEGRKGASAGTGLVRLNLTDLTELNAPISLKKIEKKLPTRVRRHFQDRAKSGGLLPPQTFRAVVDVLIQHDDSLKSRLGRFSERRRTILHRMSDHSREILAIQKESVATALKLTGLDSREVLDWSPSNEKPRSFLDDLPEASVREDVMILADLQNLPGYEGFDGASHVASKTFTSSADSRKSVTVVLANRLPLEEQTGADLIYFNERFRSFILVQYKAMKREGDKDAFRWQPGDQLAEEISRMDALLAELKKLPDDASPDSYRLNANPFFLKFCPKLVLNPDDGGLFKGFYLPLEFWKSLDRSGQLTGPKGGNVLRYDNVGRYFSNTDFVSFMGNGWLGTTIPQSASLEVLIRKIIAAGRTVTYAVKHPPPPEPDGEFETEPLWDDADEDDVGEIRISTSE